ncbi:DNA ligase 1-like [Onthophagus taurus]|uniref:DNA ligase 1-like n=1 Tax=Onthophagus taurus TaxID=166361 RepID=UPI000C20D093|nr:DNA ligase 1-like [Onthophagus taurus]XP_022900194.1 DNA ligase 1-like [Onthophagus taurus]
MDEEFFIRTPYGIDATDGANIDSVQTLDFSFGDNFILDDNNTALNGGAAIASRDVVKEEIFYDTPDNSNGPIISLGTMNNDGKIFQLPKMDLSSIGIFQDDALHTPDIIDSIMEFEKFQIPTNNKENHLPKTVTLTNVIAEDIPSTSNSIASFINSEVSSPLSSISSPASSSKKSKKRRYDDDDSDEDFVDDENDKDYIPAEEEESIVKKPKRGRPPKRGKSISSDDYSQLEPQEARYREMRDRNNEASRRSRYKRKQKEMKVVDELSLEEERNVRLKAEVEELQKTVDRFRDSLMKVMLSKR